MKKQNIKMLLFLFTIHRALWDPRYCSIQPTSFQVSDSGSKSNPWQSQYLRSARKLSVSFITLYYQRVSLPWPGKLCLLRLFFSLFSLLEITLQYPRCVMTCHYVWDGYNNKMNTFSIIKRTTCVTLDVIMEWHSIIVCAYEFDVHASTKVMIFFKLY